MRKRTRAREFALQILYQADITQDHYEICSKRFWSMQEDEEVDQEQREFVEFLVKGVLENIKKLDEKITLYAANWKLERMPVIDRNIMRMSCFELLFCDSIPPKVSINEAVELAKKYSGPEAGKFVNAILDKVKAEKEK